MNQTYDRLAAGDRLRLKRTLLEMTQDEMAEKINRAPKYYADIERGNCGMSIETLLALSETLNMSLDYILLGDIKKEREKIHTEEVSAVMSLLDSCSKKNRDYALRMLKLFLIACDKEEKAAGHENGEDSADSGNENSSRDQCNDNHSNPMVDAQKGMSG